MENKVSNTYPETSNIDPTSTTEAGTWVNLRSITESAAPPEQADLRRNLFPSRHGNCLWQIPPKQLTPASTREQRGRKRSKSSGVANLIEQRHATREPCVLRKNRAHRFPIIRNGTV